MDHECPGIRGKSKFAGRKCPWRAGPLHLDEDLRSTSAPPPLTRETASNRLFGQIETYQTRLLVLYPDVLNRPLQGELQVVDITPSSWPEYVALSYTWGEPAFPRVIHINGVPFAITENLHAFLQRYRSPEASRVLWIDAICINQLDLTEKVSQIHLMLSIYQRASHVIVWLGEHSLNTKAAIAILKTNHFTKDNYLNIIKHHHSDPCKNYWAFRAATQELSDRDWIRRMWIRQEIWAAKAITVWCGSSHMDWPQYLNAAEIVVSGLNSRNRPFHELKHMLKSLRELNTVDSELQKRFTSSKQKLAYVLLLSLSQSSGCKSTIKHDRIYALLGVASEAACNGMNSAILDENTPVRIDYSQSIEEIYTAITTFFIEMLGMHVIFGQKHSYGRSSGLDVPSWVPDYQQQFSNPSPSKIRNPTYMLKSPDVVLLSFKGFRLAYVSTITSGKTIFRFKQYLGPKLTPRFTDWMEQNQHLTSTGFHKALQHFIYNGPAVNPMSPTLPEGTLEGDLIVLYESNSFPLVLRPLPDNSGRHELIGQAVGDYGTFGRERTGYSPQGLKKPEELTELGFDDPEVFTLA